MSKLIDDIDFSGKVELYFTPEDMLGAFQSLNCEVHGDTVHFTDKSGADNCLECIQSMFEPKSDYVMPGFENLEESMNWMNVRNPELLTKEGK